MKPIVFINLPVRDLKASIEFYTRIGFDGHVWEFFWMNAESVDNPETELEPKKS